MPTLLDIAKRNGSDAVVGLIDEAAQAHPEITGMTAIPGQGMQSLFTPNARTIRGQQYKTLVRTSNPTASFRSANEGSAAVSGTYENRLVETFILNPRWECDKAVADQSEDGPEAYIADEATGVMEAAFVALGTQFYYGRDNGGDAKGHPGLIDSVLDSMTVDATGTSAGTGSSVWAVKFGPKHVSWVMGENGTLSMDDPRIESIADSNGNRYTAYVQELLAYIGIQIGHIRSIGRIKDLTEEDNKKLTDDHIADLLSKFDVGVVPDVLFMNRRSLKQLQQSRTATNTTGAPAPFPTEAFGVPIAVTDSITSTETLT